MKSFSCFKPKDPFRNWSKELDKRVAVWAQNFDSSFKLLLLGPAGAGKTTIMKQMKIIHFEGFSLEERQQKAKEIRANLLESVRELTACITASGNQIDWCDKENQTRLDFINGLNLDDQTYELYAAKIYDYSKRILTDKGVEQLFAQLNQLSITHRSQYLLNRVDEIRNVNYIPNNDDILQSRRRTSDIQKLEFQVKLPVKSGPSIQQTFCMFDVGGQRGERRKWIQVFDGVSAVMFLIDSSGFDALDEENGKNKLKETINLFHEVWTTRFLLNSNFVLLFNKQDILREKIERGIRIEDHFPEYKLYKFQPTDRHMNHNRASDKLNLFRTSSSRSTRSASTTRSHHPSGGFSIADTYGDRHDTDQRNESDHLDYGERQPRQRDNSCRKSTSSPTTPTITTTTPPSTPATTKRKSASMYLFGTSASRKNKSTKLPPDNSAVKEANRSSKSPLATTKDNTATTTTTTTTTTTSTITPTPTATSPKSPSVTDLDTLVNHDHDQQQPSRSPPSRAQTSTKDEETRRQQEQRDFDQETANHLAYIKARSFIRDKFIQITRQVDHPSDQRKFSSPNLPMYRPKGGTIGRGSSSTSSRIDRPKRNVCYHYTTATDTENIRDLFENLQRMVLKSTMKDFD